LFCLLVALVKIKVQSVIIKLAAGKNLFDICLLYTHKVLGKERLVLLRKRTRSGVYSFTSPKDSGNDGY